MTRSRLALIGSCVLLLGGCTFEAFTYTSERYGTVIGVPMTLRCRDTYEVFDRRDAATMLVSTNALNEVLVACLDGGPTLPERQREVARLFLEQKTNRPGCRLLGETAVSPALREFAYSCPADPAATSPRLRART